MDSNAFNNIKRVDITNAVAKYAPPKRLEPIDVQRYFKPGELRHIGYVVSPEGNYFDDLCKKTS